MKFSWNIPSLRAQYSTTYFVTKVDAYILLRERDALDAHLEEQFS